MAEIRAEGDQGIIAPEHTMLDIISAAEILPTLRDYVQRGAEISGHFTIELIKIHRAGLTSSDLDQIAQLCEQCFDEQLRRGRIAAAEDYLGVLKYLGKSISEQESTLELKRAQEKQRGETTALVEEMKV